MTMYSDELSSNPYTSQAYLDPGAIEPNVAYAADNPSWTPDQLPADYSGVGLSGGGITPDMGVGQINVLGVPPVSLALVSPIVKMLTGLFGSTVGKVAVGMGASALAGWLGGQIGGNGGGDMTVQNGLGFTPGGPGVPEPPAYMVSKQWHRLVTSNAGNYWIYFFKLTDGRIAMYNPKAGWKVWRPYRSIVIGKSLTTSNVLRVSRRLRTHTKALSKVLKILK